MRILFAILALALLSSSCTSFSWQGRNAGLTDGQRQLGYKDVDTLRAQYESETFWRSVRRRSDGRSNAFGRDLAAIQDTIDRHFFNYSPDDPEVNFESDVGFFGHIARFGTTFLAR